MNSSSNILGGEVLFPKAEKLMLVRVMEMHKQLKALDFPKDDHQVQRVIDWYSGQRDRELAADMIIKHIHPFQALAAAYDRSYCLVEFGEYDNDRRHIYAEKYLLSMIEPFWSRLIHNAKHNDIYNWITKDQGTTSTKYSHEYISCVHPLYELLEAYL